MNPTMDNRTIPAGDAGLTSEQPLTAEVVSALAQAAGLPLGPDRESVLLPILRNWLKDSAALNTLMQREAHRAVVPITLFKHWLTKPGDS